MVIASKGRFDRALTPEQRAARGLPATATITRDEFMEATTDLWEIAPESATRVGHPAPFPVELPQRLVELYTYAGDVVLDPFMGSGSAGVAAVRTGRRYIGFDTDAGYIQTAEARIAAERRLAAATAGGSAGADGDGVARALREGHQAKELARLVVEQAGFTAVRQDVKRRGLGIALDIVATDGAGRDWAFDVSGSFTSSRNGLRRAETLWKALGKAAVLHAGPASLPLVLLTTDMPPRGTPGHHALDVVRGPGRAVVDVIELLSPDDRARLGALAAGAS